MKRPLLEILKTELTVDPLGRGYSVMNREEAASDLLITYRTKLVPVTMTELREWASEDERALKINEAISNTGLTGQTRNIALIFDKFLGVDGGNLDPSNSLHVGFVNVLVSGSVISSDDKTDLVTKATTSISRATELDLGRVKAGDVEIARSI